MTTRLQLRTDLRNRLDDVGTQSFSDTELNTFIGDAITGLYPSLYNFYVDTTTATAGPEQEMPDGAVQLYAISVQSPSSSRARPIRGWQEGSGYAFVPKVNVSGQTLIWCWTAPFDAPIDDIAAVSIPVWGEELVKIRAEITALEQVLTNRVKNTKYFSSQVREGVTENEIDTALNALHASMETRLKHVIPLPERVG